jgi:integrase
MPDLADLADEYLDHVAATRGPHTARLRRTVLARIFVPWATGEGVTDLDAVTPALLDRFSRRLQDQPGPKGNALSATSVHTYARELNLFLGWAAQHAGGDGTLRAEAPPLRQRLLEVLSREEIDQLEAAAQVPRDKLIIRLLADTGMRVGELLNLRPCDMRREQGRCYLQIRGKTGGRMVGVEPALFRRLRAYADGGRGGAAGELDPLFVALHGGHGRSLAHGAARRPLTRSGVAQMLSVCAHLAGLHKPVGPHLLRHSYATDYLRQTHDPVTLAKILGHSSLAMIHEVYLHLDAGGRHDAMLEYLRRTRTKPGA